MVGDSLRRVLEPSPDWTALPARDAAAAFAPCSAAACRRIAKRRLRDIADARFQIEETLNAARQALHAVPRTHSKGSRTAVVDGGHDLVGGGCRVADDRLRICAARRQTLRNCDSRSSRRSPAILRFLRRSTRRAQRRVPGDGRRNEVRLWLRPARIGDGAAVGGNRKRVAAVLVSRRPVGRIFRRSPVEAERHRRRPSCRRS